MFKDKLKEYRLKKNLTHKVLAEKLNVFKFTVIKWENGKGLPNSDQLDSLCYLFEVADSELLDECELLRINRKNKTNSKLKVYFLRAVIILSIIITLDLIFVTILSKIPKPSITNDIDNYEIRSIGLAVGDSYTIDFEEILADTNIEYDEYSINKSEYYSVKKDTIIAVKEGIFNVHFQLKSRKENMIYVGSILKVYCYNPENMIPINTVEDLCNMNNNKSGSYILNSNLDLKDIENFNPIGNTPSGNEFSGMFINPNNYVIKNLTIKSSKEIYNELYVVCNGGLFGSVKNAYIDNIILENVSIDVSDFEGESFSDAGGLVSYAHTSLISNCKISGTIVGQYFVGGVAGGADYTTLINNSFNGTIIQKNCDVKGNPVAGGLAGYLYGCEKQSSFPSSCYVSNNYIHASITSDNIAGGLIGIYFGDCINDNTLECELDALNEYEFGKHKYR